MPAQIAQPCEPLAEIADTKGKTVLQWAAQTVAQYQDCAARHDAAVRAYRARNNPMSAKLISSRCRNLFLNSNLFDGGDMGVTAIFLKGK